MSETLLQKQYRFSVGLQRLLQYAHKQRYDVTMGETYRHPVQAAINALTVKERESLASLIQHIHGGVSVALRQQNNGLKGNRPLGIQHTLHTRRLAVDLQLFKDGEWIKEVGPYRELGMYWESLGPDFCWGGRFGDTPHYSIKHDGMK